MAEEHQINLEQKDETVSIMFATTTIEVTKVEPDDMTDDDLNLDSTVDTSLYADHIIKGEMVIGPTVLVKPNGSDQFVKSTQNNDDINKENYEESIDRKSISSKLNKTASHRSKGQFQKTTGYANQACRRNIEENETKRAVSPSNIKKNCSLQSKAKDIQRSHKTKNTPNKNTAKVPSKLEFICDYCKKVFHTKWYIIQHISNHHNLNTNETCKICFKTFSFKSNFMRHMKDIHGENTVFPCDICHKQFGLKRYLASHKSAVHDKDKFKCECGKIFHDKSNYNRHKRCFCKKSSKINIVTCKFCFKEYHNESRLNFHIKSIHTIPINTKTRKRKYYCDYCNKCFEKKSVVAGHISSNHMKLALYVCEICNKCFSYSHGMSRHLMSHSGRKPFSCKKCKKSFKSKLGFQRHEKACTYDVSAKRNKSTFTCEICSQEFSLLRTLNRHNNHVHK